MGSFLSEILAILRETNASSAIHPENTYIYPENQPFISIHVGKSTRPMDGMGKSFIRPAISGMCAVWWGVVSSCLERHEAARRIHTDLAARFWSNNRLEGVRIFPWKPGVIALSPRHPNTS